MDNFKAKYLLLYIPVPWNIQHWPLFASSYYTNHLYPMDLAENKPVEWFQKHKFEEWHSGEVLKQLQEKDLEIAAYLFKLAIP